MNNRTQDIAITYVRDPGRRSLIQAINACVMQVTGVPATVHPLPAPSNLYAVQRILGLQDIPYGPRIGGANTANEYAVFEDLVIATKVLPLLALDWCEVVN